MTEDIIGQLIKLLMASGFGIPVAVGIAVVAAIVMVVFKRKPTMPTPPATTGLEGPPAPPAPPIVVNDGPPSTPPWQPGDP